MYLVKYLTKDGNFEFRRYKDVSQEHLLGIIRGMEKRKGFRYVSFIKEY